MTNFTRLLRALYRGPRGAASAIADPYRDEIPGLDAAGGARRRRRNLEAYLDRVGRPRLVLLGEAIGYRGGRFSGIAFTSERQLAGEGRERLPWAAAGSFRSTSANPKLWLEPSGTIVWGALGGDPAGILLWNAFPWHPYAAGRPLSNRAPERTLLAANLHVLESLLEAIGDARLAAVGRTASAALAALEIAPPPPVLRHPAHGGATLFRAQVGELIAGAL